MKKRLFSVLLCLLVVITISAKQPKYIFYFIGDGMGLSPVLCAETYNRTVLGNDKPLLFMQFPTVTYATSYSPSPTRRLPAQPSQQAIKPTTRCWV